MPDPLMDGGTVNVRVVGEGLVTPEMAQALRKAYRPTRGADITLSLTAQIAGADISVKVPMMVRINVLSESA